MESTEVTNIDLYKALCVIKDICRDNPVTCKGCPLSIELNKIDENNKRQSYYVCRVYNQQYPNVPRPDTWKLNPPPKDYTPFDDK